MKTIIAGSRWISHPQLLLDAIDASGFLITEVVCGCAEGVDKLGEDWADTNKIPITRFPPNWTEFGKSAGPRRNEEMAKYAQAAIIIWDGKSKGSADMIRRAKNHKLMLYENNLNLK